MLYAASGRKYFLKTGEIGPKCFGERNLDGDLIVDKQHKM